eukprot:277889_1
MSVEKMVLEDANIHGNGLTTKLSLYKKHTLRGRVKEFMNFETFSDRPKVLLRKLKDERYITKIRERNGVTFSKLMNFVERHSELNKKLTGNGFKNIYRTAVELSKAIIRNSTVSDMIAAAYKQDMEPTDCAPTSPRPFETPVKARPAHSVTSSP